MKKKEYSKLTKRCRRLLSISQLWLAKDHIILIEEASASQSYRRFYFKDIEGIVLGDSSLHIVYFILSIAIIPILARIFSALEMFGESSSRIISLIILGFFLLLGIYQFIAGRISNLSIQTKNGPYKLPIRFRQRKMKKLVDKITPLIYQYQEQEDNVPIVDSQIQNEEEIKNRENILKNESDDEQDLLDEAQNEL